MLNLRKIFYVICLIGVLFYSFQASSKSYLFESSSYQPTFEFSLKGGNQRTIGRVGAVMPLQNSERGLWFTQLWGLWDSDAAKEWNIGLGYRHQLTNWIVGGYGFFDRRLSAFNHYHSQLAFGTELLGKNLETRINTYIPLTSAKVIGTTAINKSHRISLVLSDRLEKPLSGLDVEVGGNFPPYNLLQGFLTYYYFSAHKVKAMHGVQLRGQWCLTDKVALMGETNYDSFRKHQWFIGLKLQFGLEISKKKTKLTHKITQMIIRDIDVITGYYIDGKKNTHKSYQIIKNKLSCSKKDALILPYKNYQRLLSRKSNFDFIEIEQFIASSLIRSQIQSVIVFSAKDVRLKPYRLNNVKPFKSQLISIPCYNVKGLPACKDLNQLAYFINQSYWLIHPIDQNYGIRIHPKGLGGRNKEAEPQTLHLPSEESAAWMDDSLEADLENDLSVEAIKDFLIQTLAMQKVQYGEEDLRLIEPLGNLGTIALKLVDYEEAKNYYSQVLMIKSRHYSTNSIELVDTLNYLGEITFNLADYEIAKNYYSQALIIQRHYYGPNAFAIASTLNNLGNIEFVLNHFKEAKIYYRKALIVKKLHYGDKHIELLDVLESLADTEFNLEHYELARNYYSQMLDLQINHYGENHIALIHTLDNLRRVECNLEHYEAARDYYIQILAIKKNNYTENHIEIANTLYELGVLSADLKNYVPAKDYLERALRLQIRHYGKQHITIINTLLELGLIERKLKYYEAAKSYYAQALILQKNYYEKDHNEIMSTLLRLGVIELKSGHYEAAKDCLLQITALQTSCDIITTALALSKLGTAELKLGYYETARNYYNQALISYKPYYKKDYIKIAKLLVMLGKTYQKLENYKEAKNYTKKALKLQQYYGIDHIRLSYTYNLLGHIYFQEKNIEKTFLYYHNALRIRQGYYQAEHLKLVTTLIGLGKSYLVQNNTNQALMHYQRALTIQTSYYGNPHTKMLDTLKGLVSVHQALNEPDKVTLYQQQIKNIEKG